MPLGAISSFLFAKKSPVWPHFRKILAHGNNCRYYSQIKRLTKFKFELLNCWITAGGKNEYRKKIGVVGKTAGRKDLRFKGLRFTVYGLRFTVYGLRFTVYGLRFTVYGLRFTVYGLRFTVYSLQLYGYTCTYNTWRCRLSLATETLCAE